VTGDHRQALALHTPAEWSANAVDALDHWRQGDLLPTLPIFWAATPGVVDEITNVDAPLWEEGGLVAIQLEGSVPYGVVTSQTCDIAATGPGHHHPTVQVSPVVAVNEIDAGTLGNIRRFRMKAHALMTATDLVGTYVADLRISLPVSKAVLVAGEPMRGFGDEADALRFGQHVADKFGRPALHPYLSDELPSAVNAAIAAAGASSWWQKIEEVRLRVQGDRLEPTAAGLLIVARETLEPAEIDVWISVTDDQRASADGHGIKLLLPLIDTADMMSAAVFRDSTRLDVERIGR